MIFENSIAKLRDWTYIPLKLILFGSQLLKGPGSISTNNGKLVQYIGGRLDELHKKIEKIRMQQISYI